jgi:hypothetical protein
MNERTRAIEILKQARDVLLARLTERVVDGEEDILEDAAGFNYSGAIEGLHDQLGQRLGNVAALLAHLQSADDSPPAYEVPPPEMSGAVPEVDAVFGVGLEGYASESGSTVKDPAAVGFGHDPASVSSGHSERSCVERVGALDDDWTDAVVEFDLDSEDGGLEGADDFGRDEETGRLPSTSPSAGANASPAAEVRYEHRDRIVQEAVFQETDFRRVDLLTGEAEGTFLGAPEGATDESHESR